VFEACLTAEAPMSSHRVEHDRVPTFVWVTVFDGRMMMQFASVDHQPDSLLLLIPVNWTSK